MLRQDWIREASMLLLRMAIGLYVLNTGYNFEGSFKRLSEFHFISNLFTEQNENYESVTSLAQQSQSNTSHNLFADTWLENVPIPFPENYLRGIDVQQHDFENFDRPSYLRGEFQDHGWWYYYLYALVVKVPLGIWGFAILVLVLRCLCAISIAGWRNELILLSPPLVIFVVVSSKTGFSHHMRYVLPCFPFVFIWLSQVIRLLFISQPHAATTKKPLLTIETKSNCRKFKKRGISSSILALAVYLLTWCIGSSMMSYPHSLSYFNEITAGPTGGADHLINSNIDWGQDLLYLKWWKENRKDELQNAPFYLAHYCYMDPSNWDLPTLCLGP